MTENKDCDISDDMQTLEIPLKKRKDSRLYNSASTSWHIENSNSGNPLKKRFFRSPCHEFLPEEIPVEKKLYFSSAGEKKNILSDNPNSILNENKTSPEKSGIFNHQFPDANLCFDPDKETILNPFTGVKNDMNTVEVDVGSNEDWKLMKMHNVESPCQVATGIQDLSYKESTSNSSPFVTSKDLCYNNSSIISGRDVNKSKNLLDAAIKVMKSDYFDVSDIFKEFETNAKSDCNGVSDLSKKLETNEKSACYGVSDLSNRYEINEKSVCYGVSDLSKKLETNEKSVWYGVSDLSKKLETNENGDTEKLKINEMNLTSETGKMTQRRKEKCDGFSKKIPILEHNNKWKPIYDSGTSAAASQDKSIPSSVLSNYVNYFCNSEINATPSQNSPESLSEESNISHSFHDAFELSLLSLQQSADISYSLNKGDTYNCLTNNNLSNSEYEIKEKDKYYSRPSSSFDNQPNSLQSSLEFVQLLKTPDTEHNTLSELREGNENILQEIVDDVHLKSPVNLKLSKNNENSISHDNASELPSNNSVSSSHVSADSTHLMTLRSPLLLENNEDNVPPQREINSNIARNLEGHYCNGDSHMCIHYFKCMDYIKKRELQRNCLEGNEDDVILKYKSKIQLPQLNIEKDKEDCVTKENTSEQKLLPNKKHELQQNFSESEKKSEDKYKYFPSYIFSENVEDRDNKELRKSFIKLCEEQLRHCVEESPLTEDLPKQEMPLNDRNKLKTEMERSEDEKVSTDSLNYFPSYNLFTNSRLEDTLNNALMKINKRSPTIFEKPPTAPTLIRSNELTGRLFPTSSSVQDEDIIDLCTNNEKTIDDDEVKVIEVFSHQSFSDARPATSKMANTSELNIFQPVFEPKPSTSKYDFPILLPDMNNPSTFQKKSIKSQSLASYVESDDNNKADQNKRKNLWEPLTVSSRDQFLPICNNQNVISISSSSSSSPSSSPDHISESSENSVPINLKKRKYLSPPLIKCKDRYKRKGRPSILRKRENKKEIPVLTVPEDESSDEELDLILKAFKKEGNDDLSPKGASTHNELKQELECAICLESMNSKRGTSATTCGHVYCTPCIDRVIEKKGECPTCRKVLDSTQVHKLFLFA